MGSDMRWCIQTANERDADKYKRLRETLADLLGLKVDHDIDSPGHHQGATDEEIVAEIAKLISLGV